MGGACQLEEEWIAGIGTPLAEQLKPFVESDEDAASLVNRYRTFQRRHHDALTTAYEGVLDTLEELYNWGHPMGVVTSKSNEMMERGLRHTGIDVYMKTMIGCDSCAIHKPDPFPVRMALDELGYEAHEAVLCRRLSARHRRGERRGRDDNRRAVGPLHQTSAQAVQADLFLDRITELPRMIQRLQAGAIAGRTPREGTPALQKPR